MYLYSSICHNLASEYYVASNFPAPTQNSVNICDATAKHKAICNEIRMIIQNTYNYSEYGKYNLKTRFCNLFIYFIELNIWSIINSPIFDEIGPQFGHVLYCPIFRGILNNMVVQCGIDVTSNLNF